MPSDTVTITADSRAHPPVWAVLERELIQTINEAAPIFLEKYTHPSGELIWRTGKQEDSTFADDLYESFFNWPLFHALGGSDFTNEKSARAWTAITRQLSELGQVTREFVNGADWYHHGENYIYLYHLGWSYPSLTGMEARARRFAGFYLGEDEMTCNYNPAFRVIPSPRSGGLGLQKNFQFPLIRYHL